MSDIIKLTVILFSIAAIAALAIAGTYSVTAPKIELQKKQEQQQALQTVFPEGAAINENQGNPPLPQKYWTATGVEGSIVGYAFEVAKRGYSSEIKCIVGINADGKITGLKVLSQSETPGLGTRVTEAVSNAYLWNSLFKPRQKTAPWFQQQFKNISILKPIVLKTKCDEWHKRSESEKATLAADNSITAITGATISTRAVTSAIEDNLPIYYKALIAEGQTPHDSSGAEAGNN